MRKTVKEVNNCIYLMDVVSELYRVKHKLTVEQFLELDARIGLLKYISENTWYFDECISKKEMLKRAEEYVNAKEK